MELGVRGKRRQGNKVLGRKGWEGGRGRGRGETKGEKSKVRLKRQSHQIFDPRFVDQTIHITRVDFEFFGKLAKIFNKNIYSAFWDTPQNNLTCYRIYRGIIFQVVEFNPKDYSAAWDTSRNNYSA